MKLWDGFCIVHETFSEREIIKVKLKNKDAELIAHPECPETILTHSDHIGSTSSLLNYVQESFKNKFIIATEPHIIHQMKKIAPKKTFIPAPVSKENCSCSNCPFMELNTMEKLKNCLLDTQQENSGSNTFLEVLDSNTNQWILEDPDYYITYKFLIRDKKESLVD